MIYMHDNSTGINYFFGDKCDLEDTLNVIFNTSRKEVSDAINCIIRDIGHESISDNCAFLNIEITIA